MARITVTTLVDDLDGTDAAETVTFALDGQTFEIDLTVEHADRLRAELAPWAAGGRRTGGRRVRGTGARQAVMVDAINLAVDALAGGDDSASDAVAVARRLLVDTTASRDQRVREILAHVVTRDAGLLARLAD